MIQGYHDKLCTRASQPAGICGLAFGVVCRHFGPGVANILLPLCSCPKNGALCACVCDHSRIGTRTTRLQILLCHVWLLLLSHLCAFPLHNRADREDNLIYFLHCPEGIKTVHRWALRLLDISPCRRSNDDISSWETCQGLS